MLSPHVPMLQEAVTEHGLATSPGLGAAGAAQLQDSHGAKALPSKGWNKGLECTGHCLLVQLDRAAQQQLLHFLRCTEQ